MRMQSLLSWVEDTLNLDPPCNYPQYEIYRMVRKVKKVFPLLKL